MKSLSKLTAAALAAFITALSAFAGNPAGTWTFEAESRQGRSFESTVVLKWENNRLSGSIDNAAGKAEISQARFADDQVSFTVLRKFRRREFAVNYAGKLEGDTITGTILIVGRAKSESIPWSAQRVK